MWTVDSQHSRHPVRAALDEAALAARLAPSIHNTQPWRWLVRPGALDLWADRRHQLRVADPDGRMMTISCGAALHHARVALAARGRRVTVVPFPDPVRPDHLAHLTAWDEVPVSAAMVRLYQAIGRRCTDRRPGPGRRVDDTALTAIAMATQDYGCDLHPLRPDEVTELATQAARARHIQAADEARRAELARWAGGTRPHGAGIPDANLPARQLPTTVGERDFGHPGTLPVGPQTDGAATYAILYGDLDDRPEWLEAGQALSAAWLTATGLGVSLLPFSGPVEVPSIREALRTALAGIGHPYLILRFGAADPRPGPPHTPRLPVRAVIGHRDHT